MGLICFASFSTQKILHHARMAEAGAITRDPIRESIGLELDMINILCALNLCIFVSRSDDRRQHSPRTDPRYAG